MTNKGALYSEYSTLKEWVSLFKPSPGEVALFNKELASLELHDQKFLDVGFGSGALLGWAIQQGADVAGVEIQPELLRAASSFQITTFADVADAPNNYYDVVTGFDVLEHIDRDGIHKFIEEIYRALRPGGALVLRFPNCQSPSGLVNQFGDHTHLTMLSGPIVTFMVKQAGFMSVSFRGAYTMRSKSLVNRMARKIIAPLVSLYVLVYRIVLFDRDTPLTPNIILFAYKPN